MSDLEHRHHQSSEANPDIAHTTPELKANYARPAVLPPEANKDKTRRIGHLPLMVGGAAVAIGAVAGGYFATRGGEKQSTEPVNPEPSASAPVSPGNEATPTDNTDNNTSNPEADPMDTNLPTPLSVERYQDGESLVRAWNAEYNDWMMANATPETEKNRDYSVTDDEYINRLNEPVDAAYMDALFVTDWQDRPQLVDFVENQTNIHHGNVYLNLLTTNSGRPEDIEPYKVSKEITSVDTLSQSDKEIVTRYRYEIHDNSDMNGANQLLKDPVNGATGGYTLTWQNVDSAWKIVDVSY